MAKQTLVQIIDDLDGSVIPDGEGSTVPFSIDGVDYEIDLSNPNAATLREALAEFVGAARKAQPKRKARETAGKPSNETSEARAWLREHGYKVKDKGRIPSDLLDAYRKQDGVDWDGLLESAEAALEAVTADPETVEAVEEAQAEPELVVDTSNTAVLAWWTGVQKRPAPKGNRVSPSMRAQYRLAMGAA